MLSYLPGQALNWGMSLHLALLGTPFVLDGNRREDVPLVKPAYLLLYLGYAGEWVSRDELCEVFRGNEEAPASRSSVRLLLTRARQLSWAAGVEAEAQRLRWQVDTDVRGFRSALAAQDWRQAEAAYPAPLLRGLPTGGGGGGGLPGFHEWLDTERAALHAQWLGAALNREDELLHRGAFDEAARLLGRAMSFDPLSEDLLQRFLRACHLAGARDEALRAFEQFRARLTSQMGLTPLPGTLALVDALRRGEPPAPLSGEPSAVRAPAALPLDAVQPAALVGREEPLTQLRGAATPLALVEGEPGIGKTRLLAEAWPGIHPVRCQEGLTHVPYFPLFAAVRARLPDLPDLGDYAADLARFVPEVDLAGAAPPPAEEPAGEGADSGKVRLLEALARVFAPEGVVVIDDLHWADAATLEWLVFLARRGGVRLCGAYRPGEVGPGLREALHALHAETTVVSLAPLDAAGVAALVQAVTGPEVGRGEVGVWLAARSGGNPLFVLEWLRSLWQTGAYEAQEGGWHRSGVAPLPDLGDFPLTPRLTGLVLRRADTLEAGDRRVLDLASVLGSPLRPADLARVLEHSEWAVGDALARAERLGLLRGAAFAHDVIRRAVYGALPEVRRRLMHGRVAQTLDGVLDDLVVAEHAQQAGDEAGAARRWVQAAKEAFGVRPGFEDEAVRLYERVVASGVRTPEWYRAHAYLAVRRRSAGRAGEARELIGAVLRGSGDPEARAIAHAEAATLAYMDGNLKEAASLVALAAQEAASLDDPELRREVLLMQVVVAQRSGEAADALQTAQDVVAGLRREALSHTTCNWLSLLGALLCDLGRFGEALALYREQLAAAQFLNLRSEQVKASSDVIATLHDLGRIQEGVALAEAALDLGHVSDSYPLRYHLALAYGRDGRLSEALAHAQAVWEGSPSVNMRAHACALLAELHAQAGPPGQVGAVLAAGLAQVEGCDILTARAVVVTAVVQFGPAELLERARPILAGIREEALPAYLRGDFARALAARPEAALS